MATGSPAWRTAKPFFRNNPFVGGHAVACGLHAAIEYLTSFRFERADLDYLATLRGNDGERLFEDEFLEYLGALKFACDVDAMPEGTVAFAHEPLLRIQGPVLQCQLLETPLLNLINFPTLVATKAARVCHATGGERLQLRNHVRAKPPGRDRRLLCLR